jgi:polysaccharide export outer membrane protein
VEEPFYLIGPGDSLEISVWNEPELSRAVTVRPDGRLTVPLVEDLAASGLTPQELARVIEERLGAYLKNPQVTITVTVTDPIGMPDQRVRVLGEVVRPTSLLYRAGMTLLDAITEIGGLGPFADGNAAKIIRRTAQGQEEIALRLEDLVRDGDGSANLALAPGDIIVIPEGFFSGNFRVDKRVNTSMTFTDNVDLEPDGEESSALITRLGNSLSVSAELARFTGHLNTNYDLVFNSNDSDLSLDGRLAGTSTTELKRNHLFFDLNAGINRTLLDSRQSSSASSNVTDSRQSSSASSNVTTNRDTTVTLSASPFLVHRLGDFADAEWRYRISPVLVSSSGSSDSLIHSVSNRLIGGEMFQTLGWSLDSQAGQTMRSDEDDIDFADTSLGLSYDLWRAFSLLGSVGYVYRTGDNDGNDDELNGISWDAGFRWQPSPLTSLQATYGQRDQDDTFNATLRHQIAPKTSIRASYSDERLTDQERFIQGITGFIIDDQGNFIDPATGLPFDPNDPVTSFNDTTTRTRSLRGAIRHSSGRNTVTLSGSASRETGGSEGDEDSYGAILSWTRRLSRQLSISSSAGFERNEFSSDGRDDDNYRFNSFLSYRLFSTASTNLSYSFQMQDSTDSSEEFTENTVTVGLSVGF